MLCQLLKLFRSPVTTLEYKLLKLQKWKNHNFEPCMSYIPHKKVGNKFRYRMWEAIINRYCLTKLNTM